MLDHGLACAGPVIVDSNTLEYKIDTYLKTNPKPELSQHVFYVLVNVST
jgi:hypothetical protein